MKIIIISAIVALYSCMNPTENTSVDHIVLPEVEVEEELSPDTFIPVANEELIVNEEIKMDLDKDVQSKDLQNQELSHEIEIKKETSLTEVKDVKTEVLTPKETVQVEDQTDIKDAEVNTTPVSQENAQNSAPAAEGKLIENKTIEEDVQEDLSKEALVVDNTQKELPDNLPVKADHSAFAALLQSYVSNTGDVNYKGLKSSESKLDSYLAELDKNAPEASWSKNERLAYWMNAYNAFTIKLILDNYPVSKITDLHGGKPWDVQWIRLGGKSYSLNNIEHDIIRPTFNDPRIHFAVNCAAKSCPPLLNKAYTDENVNSLLNKVTKAFVNSSSNQISGNSVQLSKIFEWYAVDFGNIIDFLNQYSAKKIDSSAKIGYLDYNWSLNEG